MGFKEQITDNLYEIARLKKQLSDVPVNSGEYQILKGQISNLEKDNKELSTIVATDTTETPSQEGHLYPVAMVHKWTQKLKNYNAQLDAFIKQISNYDNTANKAWVAQKVKTFCNKINYALAWLRYYIIKGLNGVFKKAQSFLDLIDPVVNFSLSIDSIVSWAKNVIAVFTKPYQTIITFIKDFQTYTPPLVSEAAKLIGKVSSIPPLIAGKLTQIFAEGAQEAISNIDIKFESISLGDITSGSVQKPKRSDYL